LYSSDYVFFGFSIESLSLNSDRFQQLQWRPTQARINVSMTSRRLIVLLLSASPLNLKIFIVVLGTTSLDFLPRIDLCLRLAHFIKHIEQCLANHVTISSGSSSSLLRWHRCGALQVSQTIRTGVFCTVTC
jgi:hypothetical protein